MWQFSFYNTLSYQIRGLPFGLSDFNLSCTTFRDSKNGPKWEKATNNITILRHLTIQAAIF
jgi:hypothetical protein